MRTLGHWSPDGDFVGTEVAAQEARSLIGPVVHAASRVPLDEGIRRGLFFSGHLEGTHQGQSPGIRLSSRLSDPGLLARPVLCTPACLLPLVKASQHTKLKTNVALQGGGKLMRISSLLPNSGTPPEGISSCEVGSEGSSSEETAQVN